MTISTASLYRDSLYFMRNQLATILLLSFCAALLSICIERVFQLTIPIGSAKTAVSAWPQIITHMIVFPLLNAWMLALLKFRSSGHHTNARQAMASGLVFYSALFSLGLVTYIIATCGVGVVLILLMLLGLLTMSLGKTFALAIVCIFPVVLYLLILMRWVLAPCIIVTTRQKLIKALQQSWQLTATCWRSLLAGTFLIAGPWLILTLAIALLCPNLLNKHWVLLLASTLGSFVNCWMLVYRFRLYTTVTAAAADSDIAIR